MSLQPQQQGTALVVGLVILAILTVLGTSSLSNSLLGERMAANTQNNTLSFHTADSAVQRTVALLRQSEAEANDARTNVDTLSFPELIGTRPSTNTTNLEFTGARHINGSKANDRNGVIAHSFRITSTATITNTPTSTTVRQSVGKGPYLRDQVKELTINAAN